MSTCNRLDLATLGYQLVLPKKPHGTLDWRSAITNGLRMEEMRLLQRDVTPPHKREQP